MNVLKKILPEFVQRPILNLQKRVEHLEVSVRVLEMAVDAFIVNPKYVPGDDIGFNGQRWRKQIFKDVTSAISFDSLVETGTWLGNTTGYMSQTAGRPVFTCELSPRFHALAKMRLAGMDQIHPSLGDSRKLLRELTRDSRVGENVFFYLDAHWYDDLPLAEEMDIVAGRWKQFVVMIDDFKVDDDPGYTYDDYGPGKALTLELLAPSIRKHNLSVFFPKARAAEETGNRRGCVVLGSQGEMTRKLLQVPSLRQWTAPG